MAYSAKRTAREWTQFDRAIRESAFLILGRLHTRMQPHGPGEPARVVLNTDDLIDMVHFVTTILALYGVDPDDVQPEADRLIADFDQRYGRETPEHEPADLPAVN